MSRFATLALALGFASVASVALAAPCSNSGGQYEQWKPAFAAEAQRAGVGQRGIQALMNSSYSNSTIAADRNQKSFRYSLDRFLQVRGAPTIVSQGRNRKARNAGFYQSLKAATAFPPAF